MGAAIARESEGILRLVLAAPDDAGDLRGATMADESAESDSSTIRPIDASKEEIKLYLLELHRPRKAEAARKRRAEKSENRKLAGDLDCRPSAILTVLTDTPRSKKLNMNNNPVHRASTMAQVPAKCSSKGPKSSPEPEDSSAPSLRNREPTTSSNYGACND
jgi:hypothetical protein